MFEMTAIQIKKVKSDEERKIFHEMPIYGYYPSITSSNEISMERSMEMQDVFDHREYILYEDEYPVSGGAYTVLSQNIRGKIFKMGGVLNINTYPEARRKGYVNQLMNKLFEDMKDEDIPFTCLYPFKPSFYGRYDYVNFPQYRDLTIKPQNFREVNKRIDEVGNYANFKLERGKFSDNWGNYVDLLRKMQENIHGMSIFMGIDNMPKDLIQDAWSVTVKTEDGEIIGMMTYSTKGIFKEANVRYFLYLTSPAKFLLLQYMYLHTDQFTEFKIPIRPDERPEYWGYDIHAEITTRDWVPVPQGRILRISEIEGLNVGLGELTLKINDRYCGWNNKSWKFTSEDGSLKIEEITGSDNEIDIGAFSALVYGTYHPNDFQHRWNTNLPEEIIVKLQKMFPPSLPWLFADF